MRTLKVLHMNGNRVTETYVLIVSYVFEMKNKHHLGALPLNPLKVKFTKLSNTTSEACPSQCTDILNVCNTNVN